MLSLIIAILIACYAVWVIHKKIQDVKAGRFCGGDCEGCMKSCSKKE